MEQIACCTSFNSFFILPYSSSCFTPYLCKMSLEASSMAPWTKTDIVFMSIASNWGLLACVFFLVKGFFGETFLFCGVIVSAGGSFGGVASPSPFFSPSSPPPCPYCLVFSSSSSWASQIHFLQRRCPPHRSLYSGRLPASSSSSSHWTV
jgi:hypothetical protein